MMVDDAHSSGVLGRDGRGTVDHLELPRPRGHSGRHAQQGHRLDGRLRLRLARSDRFPVPPRAAIPFFHFASAVSRGHLPGGVRAARFAGRREADQETLGQHEILQAQTEEAGVPVKERNAHHSDHVGDAAKAFEFSRQLFDAGVFAPAVGYPTVAEGKARLRAIVTATHKREHLLRAADILAEVGKTLGIV